MLPWQSTSAFSPFECFQSLRGLGYILILKMLQLQTTPVVSPHLHYT